MNNNLSPLILKIASTSTKCVVDSLFPTSRVQPFEEIAKDIIRESENVVVMVRRLYEIALSGVANFVGLENTRKSIIDHMEILGDYAVDGAVALFPLGKISQERLLTAFMWKCCIVDQIITTVPHLWETRKSVFKIGKGNRDSIDEECKLKLLELSAQFISVVNEWLDRVLSAENMCNNTDLRGGSADYPTKSMAKNLYLQHSIVKELIKVQRVSAIKAQRMPAKEMSHITANPEQISAYAQLPPTTVCQPITHRSSDLYEKPSGKRVSIDADVEDRRASDSSVGTLRNDSETSGSRMNFGSRPSIEMASIPEVPSPAVSPLAPLVNAPHRLKFEWEPSLASLPAPVAKFMNGTSIPMKNGRTEWKPVFIEHKPATDIILLFKCESLSTFNVDSLRARLRGENPPPSSSPFVKGHVLGELDAKNMRVQTLLRNGKDMVLIELRNGVKCFVSRDDVTLDSLTNVDSSTKQRKITRRMLAA